MSRVIIGLLLGYLVYITWILVNFMTIQARVNSAFVTAYMTQSHILERNTKNIKTLRRK